jgi:3',5'-nucleoside bisphosphate phosphatase
MVKKVSIFIFQLCIINSFIGAQNLNRQTFQEMEQKHDRKLIRVPDIDGYITIKGDFHSHSVFSDGTVWPENRIEEAWSDGLDAIAITDHFEYRPHKENINEDYNAAFKIAGELAAEKNIILVHAVEITKKMPPGHFNALFIQDAGISELADTSRQAFLTAIEKLHNQGAFIFWNHPGWAAQQKDTVKWFDIHQTLLEKGWLGGIEVFNYNEWYPVALEWALTKKLAPLANSDIHDPVCWTYNCTEDFIRPMTLVFAKNRSEKSIQEAMMSRRTVCWFNGQLAGSEDWLSKLFDGCLQIENSYSANGKITYQISNTTDFTFHLKGLTEEWKKQLDILPRSAVTLTLPEKLKLLKVEIINWHTGLKTNLVKELNF